MKQWGIGVVVATFLLGGSIFLAWSDEPGSKTVTGEVISLCNYLAKDLKGPENKAAGSFLVDRGLPVAILEDGTDEIYIAILKNNDPANKKLSPLMGQKVTARGPVFEKKGVKLIEIQVVAEAM